MIPILFIPPHGDPIEAQDFAIIEKTLQNSDPEYWESGSGDAGLHEVGSDNKLILQFVRGRGFCVTHEFNINDVPRVLIGDNSAAITQVVRLSGNQMTVPQSYFVSVDQAIQAAKAFFETRLPMSPGIWVEFDPQL